MIDLTCGQLQKTTQSLWHKTGQTAPVFQSRSVINPLYGKWQGAQVADGGGREPSIHLEKVDGDLPKRSVECGSLHQGFYHAMKAVIAYSLIQGTDFHRIDDIKSYSLI